MNQKDVTHGLLLRPTLPLGLSVELLAYYRFLLPLVLHPKVGWPMRFELYESLLSAGRLL